MLVVEPHPGEVVSFDDFCRHPAPAVALDGYVSGPTRWDTGRMHVNFNHHEGTEASRTFVRATCEQVAFALQSGMPVPNGLTVHVNDADPDVCLSVWLLEHPERGREFDVDRLVRAEGFLDTTAGCCTPPAAPEFLDELSWIFDPWAARRAESSASLDGPAISTILDEVSARIDQHLAGQGGSLHRADDYLVLDRRGPVTAVVEQGPLARARMHVDGIDIFVSVTSEQEGCLRVTIGKMSPFVAIDLVGCYDTLNELEALEGSDRWGGSDTVGGSPRRRGTTLSLDEILDAVAQSLAYELPVVELPLSAFRSARR